MWFVGYEKIEYVYKFNYPLASNLALYEKDAM